MAKKPTSTTGYNIPPPPAQGTTTSTGRKKAGPAPINVPVGYTVTTREPYVGQGGGAGQISAGGGNPAAAYGPNASLPVTQGARYFKGDGWRLMPTNAQDIQTMQQALVQTALLDPKGVVYGQWDPKSATAFEKLLGIANAAGVEWKDALQARIQSTAAGNLDTKQKAIPALTINLTNPDDIKAVIQNTAKTLTGGVWSDADVSNMVATYQAQERAAQTQAYYQKYDPNADAGLSGGVQYVGGAGPGGETTNPAGSAGLDQQVKDALIKEHPAEAAVGQFTNNLSSILGSLGWGGKAGG